MNSENLNSGEHKSVGNNAEGEGSIFSQNLELDFQSAMPPRRKPQAFQPESSSGLEERRTYFGIEASKVLDILREELERIGDSMRDLELVDDLWRSWQALWGDSEEREQIEFSSLFGTASQAMSAASRREHPGLAPQEKLALNRLLLGMERLASGRSGADDLEWCREAGNRVSRMVAAWMSEGLKQEEKPAPKALSETIEDISGSIDEWFSQVSKFIPQSPEDEFEVGAGLDQPPVQEPIVPVQEPPSFMEESEPVEPETRPFEIESPEPELETADDILAAAELDGWELAVEESPAEPQDLQDEDAAEGNLEDIVIEGASEGWLAEIYFSESCLDVVETIRNNIDRLEGSSTGRTARMLCERVEYLIQLAGDFGIADTDVILESLHMTLKRLTASGRGNKSGADVAVEELLSKVDSLEQECGVATTPAW